MSEVSRLDVTYRCDSISEDGVKYPWAKQQGGL